MAIEMNNKEQLQYGAQWHSEPSGTFVLFSLKDQKNNLLVDGMLTPVEARRIGESLVAASIVAEDNKKRAS
jgi:hypothetical protein